MERTTINNIVCVSKEISAGSSGEGDKKKTWEAKAPLYVESVKNNWPDLPERAAELADNYLLQYTASGFYRNYSGKGYDKVDSLTDKECWYDRDNDVIRINWNYVGSTRESADNKAKLLLEQMTGYAKFMSAAGTPMTTEQAILASVADKKTKAAAIKLLNEGE